MAVPKLIMVTLVITLFTLAACRHLLDLDQAEKREEGPHHLNVIEKKDESDMDMILGKTDIEKRDESEMDTFLGKTDIEKRDESDMDMILGKTDIEKRDESDMDMILGKT